MTERHVTDQQQLLADMARDANDNRRPTALPVSPGDRVGAWVVKVKSHVQYNVYKVRRVAISEAGVDPYEFGEELDAFNLAEPFTSTGTLAAGTCAVMFRSGQNHVFAAKP
jgi:hypothetical protein